MGLRGTIITLLCSAIALCEARDPRFGIFQDGKRASGLFGTTYDLSPADAAMNGSARFFLPWDRIQPKKPANPFFNPEFDFTEVDALVKAHAQRGVKLFFTLISCSPWATEIPCVFRGASIPSSIPKNMDDYERYVRAVVNRYKGQVAYWQIENEISDRNGFFSCVNCGDGQMREERLFDDYIKLLRVASRVIREATADIQPSPKIVLGSIPDVYDMRPVDRPRVWNFFRMIVNNPNADALYDLFDFHQYFDYAKVEPFVNEIRALYPSGRSKELVSSESGDLDLLKCVLPFGDLGTSIAETVTALEPICRELFTLPMIEGRVTVILIQARGLKITPEEALTQIAVLLKSDLFARGKLEQYQAQAHIKRFAINYALGVRTIQTVSGIDVAPNEPASWYFHQMGLIDHMNLATPTLFAYRTLTKDFSWHTGGRFLGKGPMVISFRVPGDSNPRLIAWSDEGPKTVDLAEIFAGQATVCGRKIPTSRLSPITLNLPVSSQKVVLDETPTIVTSPAKLVPVPFCRP